MVGKRCLVFAASLISLASGLAQRPTRPDKAMASRCLALENLILDEETGVAVFELRNCGQISATAWSIAFTFVYEDGSTRTARVTGEAADEIDFFTLKAQWWLEPGLRRTFRETIPGGKMDLDHPPVDFDAAVEAVYFEDGSSCGEDTLIERFAQARLVRAVDLTQWVRRVDSEKGTRNASSQLRSLSSDLAKLEKDADKSSTQALRKDIQLTLELIEMGLKNKSVDPQVGLEMFREWVKKRLETVRMQIRTAESPSFALCSE